ncbi:MAG: hypothetical protein R2848_00640 [Thermomicrobiales bacterium]
MLANILALVLSADFRGKRLVRFLVLFAVDDAHRAGGHWLALDAG